MGPVSQPTEAPVTIEAGSAPLPVPVIYRVMKKVECGLPAIGPEDLGVVVGYDVHPGPNGVLTVLTEGMSGYCHWKKISANRLPRRVGGRADNVRFCFRIGSGSCESGPVTEHLAFVRDTIRKKKHGIIGPVKPIILAEYVGHLAATREHWVEDET